MDATTQPWWKSAVVYQIYPRSFADSNGDGVGDLAGIIAHLDHLVELGVDAVWLSPIFRSPMVDNGYDIADYDAVDPLFGTQLDFDALVEGLHARGIKLVLDMVLNHTSDQHPWFVESRTPGSSKRDWYYWRPARAGHEPGTPGAEPTNWGCFFGGRGWAYDEASGEYYLHLFSPGQPDLNWENPEVRAELYAMMRRWIDRGVDGFRFDVINLISKRLPFTDGAVGPGEEISRDVDLVTHGPRLIEFLEEMNREIGIDERQLLTVGEMVLADVEHARAYTSQAHQRLGMVFTFEHVSVDQTGGDKWQPGPLDLPALKQTMARWQDGLAEEGWNSLYWENHDQPRSVSRFGDDRPEYRVPSARTLGTVLLTHRGTPFIYQGQEIGMTNAGLTSIDAHLDVESVGFVAEARAAGRPDDEILAVLAQRGRDNARTPMQWTPGPKGGFTDGTPWLPLTANWTEINVLDARADEASVFRHYRRLIALRHESDALTLGRFELLLPDDPKLWVFTRTWEDETILVIANMSSEVTSVPMADLPPLDHAHLLLSSRPADTDDPGTLEPWESLVYRLD